jgi:predicted ATPase/DNA-binding SARP family transcriptional activator
MGLDVRVLGDLSLSRSGAPVELGGRRPRALLALLIVERGRPIPIDTMVERLWPDEPPEAAVKTIQVYVSRLRGGLGEDRGRIASRGGGYELALADDELDAAAFAEDVARGRDLLAAGSAQAALERLDRALGRWRGRPFGDLADEPFLLPETTRLEGLAAEATERRAEALVAMGRTEEAIGQLRRLVADTPGRESAWSRLLLALYAAGRQAEALEAFHRVRTYLDAELGIEPGPELQSAHLAVLQQTAPIAPSPVGASAVPPSEIGAALLGRDTDLANVEGLFREGARLVTLVGPGGIGKTTLCRAVLTRLRPFVDGPVTFVELDALRDADLVPSAVAAALGGDGEAADQIGESEGLLGLDNIEQVIEAARWVASLLDACPRLRVVVTSREPLRIVAEVIHPVGPLDEAAARQLFLERARRVRPDLEATPDIDAVCLRLDRLPLAIELAAARTNLLSPAALVGRLDRALDILGAAARDRTDRQRTLRTTIAWSYDLLDDDLRRAFRRLSCFAGGFTLDAAESVAEASLDDLDSLLAQNLVTARYDGSEPRFSMLETIRAFAVERLEGEDDVGAVRARQAAWAVSLVAGLTSTGRPVEPGVRALATELDNLRAAMAWAAQTGDHVTRLRIAVGLSDVWQTRGHLAEARRWLEPDLDTLDIPDDLRAEALEDASSMALRQGLMDDLRQLAERLLEVADRTDQPRRRVAALAKLAQVELRTGNLDEARRLHAEALSIAVRDADRRPLLVSITGQANADLLAGRTKLAVAAFEEAVSLALEVGRPESMATAWFNLGLGRVIEGRDAAAARTALAAAAERYGALDDPEGIGYVLVAVAALLVDDDPSAAATALGASAAALASVDARLETVEARLRAETEDRISRVLDVPARSAAIAAGEALDTAGRAALIVRAVQTR